MHFQYLDVYKNVDGWGTETHRGPEGRCWCEYQIPATPWLHNSHPLEVGKNDTYAYVRHLSLNDAYEKQNYFPSSLIITSEYWARTKNTSLTVPLSSFTVNFALYDVRWEKINFTRIVKELFSFGRDGADAPDWPLPRDLSWHILTTELSRKIEQN